MDIPTHEELAARYRAFCVRHNMAESRFGRDSTGEPGLIARIEAGGSPSLKTLQRVASFMAEHDAKADDGSSGKGDDVTASAEAA